MGEESGRGSGRVRLFVELGQRFAGSGPRKVARIQLCDTWQTKHFQEQTRQQLKWRQRRLHQEEISMQHWQQLRQEVRSTLSDNMKSTHN